MPPPQPLGMQITANITPHAPHFSHSFAPPLVPGGFAPPSPPLGAHPSALPSRTRCGAGAAYPDPEAHAAMHFVRPDVHARGSHAPAQRSPHGHRSPAIASVSVPDLRIAHRRCPISPYSSPSPPGIAHGRGPVSPYSSPSPPSGPRWSPDGLSHSQSARVLSDGVGGTPRSARVHRTHSDTWGPPSPDKAQRVFKPSSKYSLPKHWRSPTKYFDRPSRAQFRSKTEPPTRNSEPEGLSSGGLALAPDPLDILAARQSVDIPLARKSVDIPGMSWSRSVAYVLRGPLQLFVTNACLRKHQFNTAGASLPVVFDSLSCWGAHGHISKPARSHGRRKSRAKAIQQLAE